MSRSMKIVALSLIIVLAVAVSMLGYFMSRSESDVTNGNQNTNSAQNSNQTNTNVVNTNTVSAANTNATNTPTNETATQQSDQSSVLRLARIFVERYGSFSNRNNFENITSLEPFMTEGFQKESAEYISKNQSDGIAAEFYSIATTVASLKMTEYTEGDKAVVRVATRRVETKGSADPTAVSQYIRVTFENVSGSWKVSQAVWE